MREVTYTAEASLRHPGVVLRGAVADLLASRQLAWRLFRRDFSAAYRQSLLGIAWSVVPALVTVLGFTLLKETGVADLGETPYAYPAYVMLGMTLWQTFWSLVHLPLRAISSSTSILVRLPVKPEALVLSKMGHVAFSLATKLVLVVVLFASFQVKITWGVLPAVLCVAVLALLGLGLGLMLVPVGSLFHDLPRAIGLLGAGWLAITPVVYALDTPGTTFGYVVHANPVTYPVAAVQQLVHGGTVDTPVLIGLLIVAGLAAVLCVVGWVLVRLSLPYLVERMGS